MLVEIGDELGDDETGRDVAANDLGGLLRELREEFRRPKPVAEQFRDQATLRVMLVLGDGARLECLAVEVAGQDEGAILLYLVPGEAEEGMLGLKVADLQGAVGIGTEVGATAGEYPLRFGQ